MRGLQRNLRSTVGPLSLPNGRETREEEAL